MRKQQMRRLYTVQYHAVQHNADVDCGVDRVWTFRYQNHALAWFKWLDGKTSERIGKPDIHESEGPYCEDGAVFDRRVWRSDGESVEMKVFPVKPIETLDEIKRIRDGWPVSAS